MEFDEALNILKNGGKIRKNSWGKNSYLMIVKRKEKIYSKADSKDYICIFNRGKSAIYQFKQSDIFADDWDYYIGG